MSDLPMDPRYAPLVEAARDLLFHVSLPGSGPGQTRAAEITLQFATMRLCDVCGHAGGEDERVPSRWAELVSHADASSTLGHPIADDDWAKPVPVMKVRIVPEPIHGASAAVVEFRTGKELNEFLHPLRVELMGKASVVYDAMREENPTRRLYNPYSVIGSAVIVVFPADPRLVAVQLVVAAAAAGEEEPKKPVPFAMHCKSGIVVAMHVQPELSWLVEVPSAVDPTTARDAARATRP